MFDFVLKTRDDTGKLLIRRFDTASEFLGLCEIVRSDYLLDEVVEGVEYGDQDVSLDGIETVLDLYHWMCSDECEWFG